MDNNSQKDELRVERYDAATADMKRKKILKRIGIRVGIGVAAAAAVLGYFKLVAKQDRGVMLGGAGSWYNSVQEEPKEPQEKPIPPAIDPRSMPMGGAGSWYNSVQVPPKDSNE